jgi:hypothetical protein
MFKDVYNTNQTLW